MIGFTGLMFNNPKLNLISKIILYSGIEISAGYLFICSWFTWFNAIFPLWYVRIVVLLTMIITLDYIFPKQSKKVWNFLFQK